MKSRLFASRPAPALLLGSLLLAPASYGQLNGLPPGEPDLKARPRPNGIVAVEWNGEAGLEVSGNMRDWTPQAATGVPEENTAQFPMTPGRLFFRTKDRDGRVSSTIPLFPGLPSQAPVFQTVTLGAFDGQSAQVIATLPQGGPPPPAVFPYAVGDKLIIFRDDGTAGDHIPGDRNYTGLTPLSTGEVQRMMVFLNGLPPGQPHIVFKGASRRIDEVASGPAAFQETKMKLQSLLAGGTIQLPLHLGVARSSGSGGAGLAASGGGTAAGGGGAAVTSCGLFPSWQKTLLITKLDTVEDWTTTPPGNRTYDPCTGLGTPGGAWTFGKLMEDMANTPVSGIPADQFARRWLLQWAKQQNINGDTVPARATVLSSIIKAWEIASGGIGSPLDMKQAPFRLLAIVNRLDLRGNVTYGGGSSDPCNPACNSGEARFVFCYCGHQADPSSCPVPVGREFLVIMEYCVPHEGCRALHKYACEWAELECLTGDDYNQALEKITTQFAGANAMPHKPNGSALSQLRTNDNFLNGLWELREYRIFSSDSDAGHLRPVTVKQTPAGSKDTTPQLQDYINTSLPLAPNHTVPLEWAVSPGNPVTSSFLGGRATMAPINPPGGSVAWATLGSSVLNMLRHDFALNTCNGCHHVETASPFVHVGCRQPGATAFLSGFLVGSGVATSPAFSVSIPGSPAATVKFFDLQRREQDLVNFILTPCGLLPFSTGLGTVSVSH